MQVNELVLSNDLKQIEFEINHHKQIAGQSIWEIGRRLSHVKENDLAHGEFIAWVENKLNINRSEAYRYMKVASEIPNDDTWQHLGNRALYLIATLPEEERVKEHKTSSGEVKKVDDMTVREIEDLKKRIKEKEQKIKELENKEPEIIEKEVIKEVKPFDYDGLKSDNQQLSQALKMARDKAESAIKRNEFIENQHKEMLKKRAEVDEKSKRYDELTEGIQKLEGKMDAYQKRISSYKDVMDAIRTGNLLIDELSGIVYASDFDKVENRFIFDELSNLINRIDRLNGDLKRRINQSNILEGEIIDG